MHNISERGAGMLWVLLLTAASTATTLALACATPFPALAALAAVHLRRRNGVSLMLLAWAASQFVGFFLLGYPRDASTLAWGVALGTAAVGSALASYAALQWRGVRSTVARLTVGYAAGFLGFNTVIALSALVLGGLHTATNPHLLADQLLLNGAILIGLLAIHRVLVALGVPAAPRPVSAGRSG